MSDYDPEQPEELEQPEQSRPLDDAAPTDVPTERPAAEPTGNPIVDSVLESLDRLDQVPVAEHVAVFEAAHERLRGALADAGDDASGP